VFALSRTKTTAFSELTNETSHKTSSPFGAWRFWGTRLTTADYSLSNAAATLSIRRVEYDIEREIKALGQSGLPRADWIAKTLLAAAPQMP
jgi:hypothetical protein